MGFKKLVIFILFFGVNTFAEKPKAIKTEGLALLTHSQFLKLNDNQKQRYVMELRKIVSQLDASQGHFADETSSQIEMFVQLFLQNVEAQSRPLPPAPVPPEPGNLNGTTSTTTTTTILNTTTTSTTLRQSVTTTTQTEPLAAPSVDTTISPTPTTLPSPPVTTLPTSTPTTLQSEAPPVCLRCIYGGFVITGNGKCSPVKSLRGARALKFPEDVDSKNFKCTGGDVMCNPMLYGWESNGKPHCISRRSNASEECGVKAKNDADSFKRAKSLIENDKGAFDTLKRNLEQICKGENLCKRSERTAARSDIGSTCEAIKLSIVGFKKEAGLADGVPPNIDVKVNEAGAGNN